QHATAVSGVQGLALDAPLAMTLGARRRTIRWEPPEAKACPPRWSHRPALPGRRRGARSRDTGRRINLARRSTGRSTRRVAKRRAERRGAAAATALLFAA